jgi:hypothetical protein
MNAEKFITHSIDHYLKSCSFSFNEDRNNAVEKLKNKVVEWNGKSEEEAWKDEEGNGYFSVELVDKFERTYKCYINEKVNGQFKGRVIGSIEVGGKIKILLDYKNVIGELIPFSCEDYINFFGQDTLVCFIKFYICFREK